MSGKLRVTLGVLPSGTGVTCTRRYERRETEVATAAYNYYIFGLRDFTFSWTTACSPKRITFPGAETKNESMGIDHDNNSSTVPGVSNFSESSHRQYKSNAIPTELKTRPVKEVKF
jgi:hypothetical protein